MLSYIYSCFNPYYASALVPSPIYHQPIIEKFEPEAKLEVQADKSSNEETKKYQRTWKKHQVEEIFNLTNNYCREACKRIEELTIRDFKIIAQNSEQTPEQVMNKVNEIHISGTLRPGI